MKNTETRRNIASLIKEVRNAGKKVKKAGVQPLAGFIFLCSGFRVSK